MKKCFNCDSELTINPIFCPVCGTRQDPASTTIPSSSPKLQPPTLLYVLCGFTLAGSLFGIGRGWFYEMVVHSDYWRGWGLLLFNIGTLISAILMMNRKMLGLWLYTFFQLGYIALVLFIMMLHKESLGQFGWLSNGIAGFFFLPSIIFLILYWLKMNRKYLN